MATNRQPQRHRRPLPGTAPVVARLVAAFAGLALALGLTTAVTAEGEARATIRVEGARVDGASPGQAVSQVVVGLAPGQTLTAYEVELAFDPMVAAVLDMDPLAPGTQLQGGHRWPGAIMEVENEAGAIRAEGAAESPCTGPELCVLFTIHWAAVAPGETEVTVTSFMLVDGGAVVDEVAVADGLVGVVTGAGEALAGGAPGESPAALPESSAGSESGVPLVVGALVLLAAALGLFTVAAGVTRAGRRLLGMPTPEGRLREHAKAVLDRAERAGREAGGGTAS